jgi:hypothetical protein
MVIGVRRLSLAMAVALAACSRAPHPPPLGPDGGVVGPDPLHDSKWWPSNEEILVKIDDHDFCFYPLTATGTPTPGAIDGPFSHDGRYLLTANAKNQFAIAVNVGTDDAQTNDLDVKLSIRDDIATVTGKVQDNELSADGLHAEVTGDGTSSVPFLLGFLSGSDVHTVAWYPQGS